MKRKRISIILLGTFLGLFAVFFCLFVFLKSSQPELGVTFSSVYAKNLSLDSRQTYLAILDDLKVKKIRLPIYWSEIEPSQGQFVWDEVDFFVAEAEKHGVELILVIGRKVPRWPECFIPDWAEGLSEDKSAAALLSMEKTVIERYKNNSVVERWQVENEPFFPFGVCPVSSPEFLKKEISLVRSLSAKPVVLTVSGELDPWWPSARAADILGVSMYRVSYNPATGLFPYPLPALVYRLRSWVSGLLAEEIFVSELQAEPWFDRPIEELNGTERAAAFTTKDLADNLSFAKDAGFLEVYLWGAEWWYVEKLAGRPALWNAAAALFSN